MAISFGAVIVMLAVLAGLSYSRLGNMTEDIMRINKSRYPKILLANSILVHLHMKSGLLRNLLIMGDDAQVKKMYETIDGNGNGKQIAEALEKLDKTVSSDKERQLLKEVDVLHTGFAQVSTRFIDLIRAGKKDEAKTLLLNDMRPVQLKYLDKVADFQKFQEQMMDTTAQASMADAHDARLMILLLALGAGAVSVLAAVMATRSITAPLQQAVQVAETVAAGDLTSRVEIDRADEAGRLLQALQFMNGSLRNIVDQVRSSTRRHRNRVGPDRGRQSGFVIPHRAASRIPRRNGVIDGRADLHREAKCRTVRRIGGSCSIDAGASWQTDAGGQHFQDRHNADKSPPGLAGDKTSRCDH